MPAMEWREIPSFPEYEVSEFGEVRRSKRGIRGGRVGFVLKPFVRSDGYRMYILRKGNASFHRKAHQLVADAFLAPKPAGRIEVCHVDGTRTNDHHTNLKWGTSADNKADMLTHGTRMKGSRHKMARLTDDDVSRVRAMAAEGTLQRVIAEVVGTTQSHVSRLVRGVRRA